MASSKKGKRKNAGFWLNLNNVCRLIFVAQLVSSYFWQTSKEKQIRDQISLIANSSFLIHADYLMVVGSKNDLNIAMKTAKKF